MIKPLIEAAYLLPMVNQEGGAMPGKGLTALETFTRYFAGPVLLFIIISGLAWVTSAPKREKKDVINSID